MIKYFCDRCGKELDPLRQDKEILLLTTRLRYSIPREWDDKPWNKVLCHACTIAFFDWLDKPKKENTDDDARNREEQAE